MNKETERQKTDNKIAILQLECDIEKHKEIVALLKEIRDAINVFKEFVLEVTPQDAKDDIEKLN